MSDNDDSKSNPTQQTDLSPVSIKSDNFESNLKVVVQAGDPEKYTVQFSWPRLEDNKILRVRLNSVLTEINSSQTYFTHQVDHNQILNYSFDVLDQSRKLERTIIKSVKVPVDFVVRESTAQLPNALFPLISKNNSEKKVIKIDVNRIFLNENIPLTTNTNDVDITANEIHSTLGLIQSLPALIAEQPPTADFGQAGRSAGSLSISAKKLFGNLHIIMRGEKGGKGQTGESTPGRAAQGNAPGAGEQTCDPGGGGCLRCDLKQINTIQPMSPRCSCVKYGGAGGNGAQGAQGKKGFQGLPGGDAGKVHVLVESVINIDGSEAKTPGEDELKTVVIEQYPGLGGDGGDGGSGQLGGLGGTGSGITCKGADGGEGPQGPQGPSGDKGFIGAKGSKCLFIGSENVNECEQ